ncbi:IGF-like family receptor 1 isoform X3 [Desmodus rotundus]|uniref:IGF-like family receptor 1 isoform X3 n=1 Tax=Desmodus rotundus TaxID=9430 RepID=UPI0023814934|nr:IGF-like family receptor 1 isoform X3 [Desmodus rotundus]
MHSGCLGFSGARSHPSPFARSTPLCSGPAPLKVIRNIVLLSLHRNAQNTGQTAEGSHCHVSNVEVQEHYKFSERKYLWWLLQLHLPTTHLPEPQPAALWAGTQGQGEDTWLRQVGGFPAQRRLGLGAKMMPQEASQHCGRLEYWNPDNLCCGSCLQRFGPPPCPDYEFSENCGLNDFGDHVRHPFKKCPRGQCNPDSAELCSPCGSRARAPTPTGTQRRCGEKPAPTKEPCPLKPETPSVLSSQESSSLAISSPPWTSEHTAPWQGLLTIALPLVLVLLVTSATIIRLVQQRHSSHHHRKAVHPYPDSACGDPNTSPRSLEASEAELPNLASQPLSRLLDELEVLEELIVLLDPEPGPGGSLACGTTRHLAARYGLPAAWSTFAYSLRPSRSPLRALIEMVVAREPSASLGQLGTHLAQLGRADALQVLSKLG